MITNMRVSTDTMDFDPVGSSRAPIVARVVVEVSMVFQNPSRELIDAMHAAHGMGEAEGLRRIADALEGSGPVAPPTNAPNAGSAGRRPGRKEGASTARALGKPGRRDVDL